MIRNKNTSITVFLLLVMVTSMFTLSACSKKNSETAGAQPVQNTQQAPASVENGDGTSDTGQSNKPDIDEMKSNIQDTLKQLVCRMSQAL